MNPCPPRDLVAALIVTAAGMAACRSATAPAASAASAASVHVDLASVLPTGPAYITGTVVGRDNRFTDARSARIAADPRDLYAGPRADVMLGPDVVVVWRVGRRADLADLQPGRVVTAWAGATELRSDPPVVRGRVLVMER